MPRPFALLLGLLAAACASPPPEPASSLSFRCDHGATFAVTRHGRDVEIVTAAGTYRLQPRPSSIGRKYAAGEATFILDEDRAALNGLEGQSFRRCRQAGADRIAGGGEP